MAIERDRAIEIHLISDSTGDTAARVARAAQAQFSTHPTTLVRHPRVTTLDGPRGRLSSASAGRPASRGLLHAHRPRAAARPTELCAARRHRPLRPARAAARGARPAAGRRGRAGVRAGRSRSTPTTSSASPRWSSPSSTTTASPARASTRPRSCSIGVSRTGKTPLSMYLGYLGYKTANVPLVRGIEPPAHLFRDRRREGRRPDDRPRAAGADPRPAAARASAAPASRDGYAELNRIFEELEEATAVQRRLGCPVRRRHEPRRRGGRAPRHRPGRRAERSQMTAGYVPGR